jgi:hypothetical protein
LGTGDAATHSRRGSALALLDPDAEAVPDFERAVELDREEEAAEMSDRSEHPRGRDRA